MASKNIRFYLLTLFVALCILGVGIFLFTRQLSKQKTTSLDSNRAFPTEFGPSLAHELAPLKNVNFTILSQDPNDVVGRTVIYDSTGPYYNNTGFQRIVYNNEGFGDIENYGYEYYVGKVESISNAANGDKVVTILDPETGKKQAFRLLYSPQEISSVKVNPTFLTVENLNQAKSQDQLDSIEEYFGFDTINEVPEALLNGVFIVGDVVSVIPYTNSEKERLLNNNGEIYARQINLRRFSGADDIK